ncbi:hypothetical protein QOT17_017052 [Balamuthia mandrillaris]
MGEWYNKRLQWQSSPAIPATPASSSALTTRNLTPTLLQQTCMQLSACQSSLSSCSLNSMSSTQQSNTPAPATEKQDFIGDEKGYCVNTVIDSGTSYSFMDPLVIDLVCAKTKQANYTVKLGHCETIVTCAVETEWSLIILGHDLMHKSLSLGIKIHYPEEPLPCSKPDANINGESCLKDTIGKQ